LTVVARALAVTLKPVTVLWSVDVHLTET